MKYLLYLRADPNADIPRNLKEVVFIEHMNREGCQFGPDRKTLNEVKEIRSEYGNEIDIIVDERARELLLQRENHIGNTLADCSVFWG